MPRGGEINMNLADGNLASFTQTVSLQGSIDDGATWITIAESDFTPTAYPEFDEIEIPAELWGDATRIRVIYNEDGAADQGENVIDFGFGDITGISSVTGNREMRSIDDQLRFPSVSLESLESDDFLVGESFFIEYNATNFPDGTEFGIVLNGNDTSAVIGQGGGIGLDSIEVTLPAFAFEDNGSGAAFYNEIEIVAYDPGTSGGLILDTEVNIDMDDQFLVIEGTNEEDGNYTFDLTGNRSLLTQAYDLTVSDTAVLNFNFNTIDISATDNSLTIPVLQVSIDGGASFQNISVDGEDQVAVGALFVDNNFSVGIPAEFRTTATHFRWWQELNLGQGTDRWGVSGISVELSSGNELDVFYQQINAPRAASLSHPDADDYRFEQADNNVAVFNGDSFDFTWENRIDMVNQYPAGTSLQFILYDNNEGEFVLDPDTDRPFIIGTATGTGTFTANVPFFVTNGNYGVRLIASNGNYFYEGDEDGESTTTVGNLDVFLRAIRTALVGDENDVIYAGSTVTFSTGIENSDGSSFNADELFANLIVNYNGDDWILATQQGTADISADLPPFINGSRDFRIELSEDAPLGDVGEIIGDSELENLGSEDESFIAGTIDNSIETSFAEFINTNDSYRVQFDFSAPSNVAFSLQRSINGGDYVTQNNYFGSSGNDFQSSSVFLNSGQNIRYRWVLTSGESLEISDVRVEDTGDNLERNYGTSLVPDNFADGSLNFENNTGRGLITTRDFEVGELENASLVSFDVNFDEIPANMVANQFLIFEFSTDGGGTYTELQTFPEADADEPLSGESFAFAITDAMKTNSTRFRFRQEERNNIAVSIANFTFVAGQSLPFDYISTNESILTQAILINSISVSETCIENAFDINYEIRGRFGMENILEVQYEDRTNNTGVFNLDGGLFEGITEGTGTLTGIQLPGDVIAEGGNNGDIYFRLNADDNTEDDFNFFVTGTFNEEGVEVVAPVNLDASFSLPSQRLCDLMNLEVSIDNPQNYFTYELRNAADGTVLGTLTYDPEDGDNIIEIGELTEEIVVELAVTARSSAGLECATIVSTFNDELTVLDNFQLYVRNANGNRELVEAGDGDVNCEGQANVIRLEVLRNNGGGSFSGISTNNVEWFRDDVNNPIANPGSVLGDGNNELIRSGNYFARVTDGDCVYTTESFTVTIIETPDQPTVTVTSGVLSGCEGAEDVVLTAPDGFAFYQWSSGETTQSITVEDAGSYSVSVSNESFVNSCGSEFSEPVIVEREELPFLEVGTSTTLNNGKIAAGETLESCEGQVIYFFNDQVRTVNGGTVTIIRDGVVVESTTSTSYTIEESGTYSFTWTNNSLNFDCEASSVEFIVNILEQPTDVPLLTSTGALEFCDRDGEVTLTAPAGFTQYRWYRNGSQQTSNIDGFDATSNTWVVRQSGTYTVEVGNSASCFSPRSNAIDVTVRGLPGIPGFSQFSATCGEGPITFSFSGNDLYSYQLINAFTGQPSGDAVIGNDGTTFISSASVAEATDFYLEVSYADGSGCPNSIATNEVTGSPNNVVLEADGNRLTASISRWGGTPQREIRWFRNGVLLRNRTNNGSITVTDAAEYSVEVEFEGEGLCIVTSNSIDLGSGVIPPAGSTGGRIEANSYPNPSQGGVVNVDIKGGNFGEYQINIMTLTGQVLVSVDAEKDVVDYSEQIDISNLERGIYNIQVIKGKEFKNIRYVIQ
ncbi:MAG: T9SS type A sorting domain-containing protein [Bacteroidota bacterium]